MTVRRVVANIEAAEPGEAKRFYGDILGMDVAMDQGWIITFASQHQAPAQVSFMTQGGSGTAVPDFSIEVDDIDAVLAKMDEAGIVPEYGPAEEPWGVRRCYVRDPFGRLVNILTHER